MFFLKWVVYLKTLIKTFLIPFNNLTMFHILKFKAHSFWTVFSGPHKKKDTFPNSFRSLGWINRWSLRRVGAVQEQMSSRVEGGWKFYDPHQSKQGAQYSLSHLQNSLNKTLHICLKISWFHYNTANNSHSENIYFIYNTHKKKKKRLYTLEFEWIFIKLFILQYIAALRLNEIPKIKTL